MSRTQRSALALLLVTSLCALAPAPAAEAPTAKTFTGTYVWEQAGDTGNLEAVFTPDGDNHWKVAFHFTFNGMAITYAGAADGKLGDGPLSGNVESNRKSRTFRFQGEFKDGKFQGTHAETTGGSELRTGTLTLG